MELSLTPDQYTPAVNSAGQYVDRVPYIKKGLLCPCNGYSFEYKNRAKFMNHTTTRKHKEWLVLLNANKANHYAALERAERCLSEQRLLIARLTNKITRLDLQVAALSVKQVPTTNDLITFD